jgi:hypothetical protein
MNAAMLACTLQPRRTSPGLSNFMSRDWPFLYMPMSNGCVDELENTL